MSDPATPIVGVTACLRAFEGGPTHSVRRKYVDAVVEGVGGVPLILPALGSRQQIPVVLNALHGLLVTGSPTNVDPRHYGGGPAREGVAADPVRDDTTLPLIRAALDRGMPVLAICRGIQELNVALGGTLHQHVKELPGRFDHRSDQSLPLAERYLPRHEAALVAGGALQGILGGVGSIRINSLHGQGLARLGHGLVVEAMAADGTIEAVSLPGAKGFVLGLQWHPEYEPVDDPWSKRIFEAFAAALRSHAGSEQGHARIRRVA